MSAERACAESGLLVDGDTRLLTDPCEYFHPAAGVQVGCGRLRCESCRAWVRGGPPGLALKDNTKVDLRALHGAPDWSALPFIEAAYSLGARKRLYACTCTSWVAESVAPIDNDHEIESDPNVPWRCAGHPVPDLPLSLGELRIDAASNWAQLVDKVLRGSSPRDLERKDALGPEPALWLAWLYAYLRGLPGADHLSSATAARLEDSDPQVVGGVLYFFTQFPRARGIEKLIATAEADLHRVALGYPIPEHPPALTLWGVIEAARVESLAKRLLLVPRSALPHDDLGPTAAIEFERQRRARLGWDEHTLKFVLDDFALLRNSERVDVIGSALARSAAVYGAPEMRRFVADHIVQIDKASPGRWRQVMTLLSDWRDKPAQGHLLVVAGARVFQAHLATVDELRAWIAERRATGWVDAAWVAPLEAMLAAG
ncbi:MAG: hypothetical protein HY909_14680 [Deltaproteobacteria bacterium]|nr:hypothetical protein [Deltaproteobacteria bacterium]